MENTLECQYNISSYDVGPDGRARLTAIANFLQETAYRHADALGVGYKHLAEKGAAWVLSRMRILVHRLPAWDDKIIVETWPHGLEGILALRDFQIRNQNDNLLVSASTCWLMVGLNNHRPIRIPEDFISIATRTDSVFDKSPEKIRLNPDSNNSVSRIVNYSDLDVVGHTNNVKYIEWCVDILMRSWDNKRQLKDFSITFLHESLVNDQILIRYSEPEKSRVIFSGINESTNTECFRAVAS